MAIFNSYVSSPEGMQENPSLFHGEKHPWFPVRHSVTALRYSHALSCLADPGGLRTGCPRGHGMYPTWWTNKKLLKMAIEIVDFPIDSMVIFQFAM